MASVGISIPPEHVTSPVTSSKSPFGSRENKQYGAFASEARDSQAERARSATQRLMRKRSWSVHADWKSAKRRRNGKGAMVPPTKFLLGGTISDPLNLGSLNDEEANRIANANTPVSSPMPTPQYRKEPIEVIIPPNINDPLGLNSPEQPGPAAAHHRKKNKRRKKQPSGHGEPAPRSLSESCCARSVSEGGEPRPQAPATAPAAPQTEFQFTPCPPERPPQSVSQSVPAAAESPLTVCCPAAAGLAGTPRAGRPHARRSTDEIVSPAVPQPGGRALFPRAAARGAEGAPPTPPAFRSRDEAFQYGNYNRYYGYRNPDQLDPRLCRLRREWFQGMDVLDVGCNAGHVTLTVARDYQPRRCVGIDIDHSLVQIARKNVKHYQRSGEFPVSMPLLYGDLVPPHKAPGTQFPRNVTFQQCNFVLASDALLAGVRPEYDTVLCLSITKWVHLNWGDAGIRRFFRRTLLCLRPGGRLLLEAQPWPSYGKKKRMTPRIWRNYHQIRLRPENFPDLLINEIGFERYESVGRPHHSAKGFNRQILVFYKAAAPETQLSSDQQAMETSAETAPDGRPGEPAQATEPAPEPRPEAMPEAEQAAPEAMEADRAVSGTEDRVQASRSSEAGSAGGAAESPGTHQAPPADP